MNHHEQTDLSGEPAKAFGLETIKEILVLWQKGTENYSVEFLAATLCTELERQCRIGVNEQQSEMTEARKLLLEHRVAECALADVEAKSLLEVTRNYVSDYRTRRLTDEERAREGFKILSDYDALQLLLRAIKKAPLSSSARSKLRREQKIVGQATRILERNLMAFYAVAPMVNDYCLTWNVEEDSVLSGVAELGSRDLEVVWAERNRRLELLPEATAACLDENLLVSGFEGRLQGAELKRFDDHVAACRRCAGLLDELTKSSIRMPAKPPTAPVELLRKIVGHPVLGPPPKPDRRPVLSPRPAPVLRAIREGFISAIDAVIDFIIPSSSLQVVLQGAPEIEGGGLYELQHRQVLFEDKTGQVVLFLRGDMLCLSTFADKAGVVRGLSISVIGKRKTLRVRKQRLKSGEVFYAVGPVREFLGKRLVIQFRLGPRSIRREVPIKEAEE